MKTVEIITIGDEILTGHTVNTNFAFIGERLTAIDYRVIRETTVGDRPEDIVEAIHDATRRADVVIATGGLGPTHDDITRTAVVRAFGRPLVPNAEARKSLEEFFRVRGRTLDRINEEQALLPEGARAVPNPVGTAAGIHIEEKGRHFYALPGVPAEMRAMITDDIIPFLATLDKPTTTHGVLFTTGIPESTLYETVKPVLDRYPQVKVAFLPGYQGVKIRASASLGSMEESATAVESWKNELRAVLGSAVYSETDEAIEIPIGRMLVDKHAKMAIAESCTGGLIAQRITAIPGSSAYFTHGYVTYANQAKIDLLGVKQETLAQFGAVSEQVARQMAEGAGKKSGADYAVAVTGIAGPDGGTAEKPVGLVYIAIAGGGNTIHRRLMLGNDRDLNRRRAAQAALNLLRKRLLGEE
jgi:nicotinamide-nucleotide amidase